MVARALVLGELLLFRSLSLRIELPVIHSNQFDVVMRLQPDEPKSELANRKL